MIKKVLFLGLVCSCILVLFGCAGAVKKKGSGNSGLLEPQGNMRFADVPVPAGFKLISEESFFFENRGMRVGALKYRGRANPDAVVDFYKEQMPMYNWNLLNIIGYGDQLMNFDRDTDTCIISISAKGSNVSITVSLGPKSRGSALKVERPAKRP